jgi:hypothetical protein
MAPEIYDCLPETISNSRITSSRAATRFRVNEPVLVTTLLDSLEYSKADLADCILKNAVNNYLFIILAI